MKGVIDTVHRVQKAWDSKQQNSRLGKTKRLFHKFCGTLSSHKLLLELLPSGNEYVSIFTGTLNGIIHASVNHEKVAEGLSEALCTIGECVRDCTTDQDLYKTEDMQGLVADLYAHIFLLLTSIMEWMMKKRRRRLIDSFNEDLVSVFEGELSRIRAIADRVRNLAEQNSRAELRSMRLTLEESARDIRVGLEGEKRRQAEMKHYAESVLKEQARCYNLWNIEKKQQLLESIVGLLEERAMGWLENVRNTQKPLRPFDPTMTLSTISLVSQVSRYTSEELSLHSRFLEDYFYRDRVRLASHRFDPVMVDPEVLRRISEWAKASSPDMLWLEGPPIQADDYDNPVTMLVAKVISLMEQIGNPVISNFCELRRGENLREGNGSREAQAALSLVYSFIRQLIELLPPVIETNIILSQERFGSLDGTFGSWNAALTILADLADSMPGQVYCIVDGLHWLDDRSSDDCLSEVLKVLRRERLKVLLSTTGRSTVLRTELARAETVYVESRQAQGRGIALGRQDADNLG